MPCTGTGWGRWCRHISGKFPMLSSFRTFPLRTLSAATIWRSRNRKRSITGSSGRSLIGIHPRLHWRRRPSLQVSAASRSNFRCMKCCARLRMRCRICGLRFSLQRRVCRRVPKTFRRSAMFRISSRILRSHGQRFCTAA